MRTTSTKKQTQRRRTFWLIILLVISATAGGWWLWRSKMAVTARFEFLDVRVNDDVRKLLSGESLSLHPHDRVKILSISTNIPFDLNVRLSCKGLDVNALQYEALPLIDLLPQRDPFDRYRFVIHVKHYNQDIAEVIWIVEPYAEDWLERADRIIDMDRRIVLLERGLSLLPDNSRIKRRLVDEYKALKRWEKAAVLLEQMAEAKESVDILSELLSVYQEMNDRNGMVRVLTSLIRINPNNMETRKAYAEMLEKSDDWRGAIREYEALLTQINEDERLEVYKRLGYLYTMAQDYERAIEAYLQAAKLDQKDANLHYNLSYLYEKTGQTEKADFYLDNAVTLKSSDLEGRLKLAHNLLEKGEYKKSREHLSEILDQRPDDMKALALMAQVLEKEGNKKALKPVYEKMLFHNPKDDTLIYNLGALEYEAGNLKNALPYFKNYLRLHPEDADVHGILFDIYKREKDLANAFQEAVAILELKPKETDIYGFVFDYLYQKGEYNRLISLLNNGLKSNPDQIPLRRYLVLAYLKNGEDDPAIRQMEEVLKKRPDDVDPLLHSIFERLRAGKAYGKIIGVMKQAAETYPRNAVFRGYLIFAYLKTGKEAEAMEQMEAILKLRPDDMELWLQLARLREKINDLSGAARAYQRVLEISPEHAEASEAYLRLRLKGVDRSEDE